MNMKKNNQGFSLLEIFISLSVGLVLFAGVMSVFVGMRTTTAETSSLGTLQENGRFALNVITEDLMRQSFWGDLASPLNSTNTVSSGLPALPASGDCIGAGTNNGSFPLAIGTFRTIWGVTAAANNNPMNCINDASTGSDILQLKRVLAQAFDPTIVNPDNSRYWLNTNVANGVIFPGSIAVVPTVNNGQMWQYQHHVYYVRNQAQGNVPVLMQASLNTTANNIMTFQPLVDGIERIRFMYGVDTDSDRIVNAYIPASGMAPYWDNNNSSILAVKVYILARDILPDTKYTNTNSYLMGDLPVPAANDNFRRLLLTSTVTLHNSGVESWSAI